jgi:magnesium transporter
VVQIFKSVGSELLHLDEIVSGCWIHLCDPSPAELSRVHEQLGVPEDFLAAPLDMDERARTERDDPFLLIILRIPFYRGKEDPVPYSTIPLGIVLSEKAVVTVCAVETEMMRELTLGTLRNFSTGKRNRFLLRIFLKTASRYLQYIRVMNKAVEHVEDQLQTAQRNEELFELLQFQKSVTYFMAALRANESVMARLQRSQMFQEYPEDEELLEDVLTEMRQAIEMTDITGNILTQMMGAFASIISNNLNVVMKFLAAVTIILTLPTMVASFYGMNVPLPLAEHPLAFAAVAGLALAMILATVFIFRRKSLL